MDAEILALIGDAAVPAVGAAAGLAAAAGLYLGARSAPKAAVLMRFLAVLCAAWAAVCLASFAAGSATFGAYLKTSPLATGVTAAAGLASYGAALLMFQPGERAWRRSSWLLAGVALMLAAFLRAAYQPAIALYVQAPLALVFAATVWRFQAEPLVYLAVLGVAIAATFAGPAISKAGPVAAGWMPTSAAAVSILMTLLGAALGLKREPTPNLRWYRQGLLIVPLVLATLAATAAGVLAAWYGATAHTVWTLAVWWAVLLVGSIGLKQADLFGFSSVGAATAALAVFALADGPDIAGYWGRYATVLVFMALGSASLAAVLTLGRRRETRIFARALYLVSVTILIAGLAIEPLATTWPYVGVDLLAAAAVLVLAHPHGAPKWVNYLVAGVATAGVAALTHWPPGAPAAVWYHRFLQVTAGLGVAWVLVALGVRTLLRATSSYRAARRQSEPFTVVGMTTTMVLAVYLAVQQVRAYGELMINGDSPVRDLLGPVWGLVGWFGVLGAFTLSVWLFRHTARTILFYLVGISATVYLGVFREAGSAAEYRDVLYSHLIYAVAGYGASHLLVYLYEAKFMAILSRSCSFYRQERRASTTIFTLAVTSCFIGTILAAFRLSSHAALIMLGVLAIVFLTWSFVWLRSQMLYPAAIMVTLAILAVWHNISRPADWDPFRLGVNAVVLTAAAVIWLGIGTRLLAVRGEIFELAAPAQACSQILAVLGTLFAAALALSPTFPGDVWRQPRTAADWGFGLFTLGALVAYWALAGHVLSRRLYYGLSGLIVLVLGLYVGIYLGYAGARF